MGMLHTIHACVQFNELEAMHKREALIRYQFEDTASHGVLDADKQLQRYTEARNLGNVDRQLQAVRIFGIVLSSVICSAEDSAVRCKVGQKWPLCSDAILQTLHNSRFEKVPPSEYIDWIQHAKTSFTHCIRQTLGS